jgi:hypothetical protein
MSKVISYSLFGYGKERQANCFDFNSYIRGLMINLRLARLLFPEWKVRLYTDANTANGFERMFELLRFPHSNALEVVVCDEALLTKAMLWRMKPAFDSSVEMFICRDVDSPLTYRDAQAVKEWELSNKQAHAITDSISHTISMMGGMIGFKQKYFKDYTGFTNWDEMVNEMSGYEHKGVDQEFLNRFIYPKFANPSNSSIMQHYFLGMGNTFLDGFKTCSCYSIQGHKEDCPLNIKLDLSEDLKDSNAICGHIGASGYYPTETMRFLNRYKDRFTDIQNAEDLHKDIFYWRNPNEIQI